MTMKLRIRNCMLLQALAIVVSARTLPGQTKPAATIPVRQVAPPAVSRETFSAAPLVRGLPDGHVLVMDSRGYRLIVFDSTLSTFTISADSAGTGGYKVPSIGIQNRLIPYLGDSTLFVDFQASSFVMIDPHGKVGRSVADPAGGDFANVSAPAAGNPASDLLGRLIYRVRGDGRPRAKAGDPPITDTRDTVPIIRADFNTRKVDTIASFTQPRLPQTVVKPDAGGKNRGTRIINPIQPAADQWAVLADGTLAIVREHDYHVDFVAPDGMKWSSPKLPFDWLRLTDSMKLARVDSMKRVIDSIATTGRPYGWMIMATRSVDGERSKVDTIIPVLSYTPIAEMPDYISPISNGAVRSDADGNLWILPTTSTQVGPGLLYDVVNRKGELFERVRLPSGFIVAGFGKGGVLILLKNDVATKTLTLGRTRVVR